MKVRITATWEESIGDRWFLLTKASHYNDIIMGVMASQITSLTIVYSTVYSGGNQRKHQSFATLAFVRGIHRWPVNSPHKWPVMREVFPFDDVIMWCRKKFPYHDIIISDLCRKHHNTSNSSWRVGRKYHLRPLLLTSHYIPHYAWDKITYPLQASTVHRWSLGMDR